MKSRADYIKARCFRMKPGDCISVPFMMFQDAFPPDHHLGGIYETSRQVFLSSMVGSAWGAWTVDQREQHNEVVICHHFETNKRVYCDPDRDHLFKKMPDGELWLKDPRPERLKG